MTEAAALPETSGPSSLPRVLSLRQRAGTWYRRGTLSALAGMYAGTVFAVLTGQPPPAFRVAERIIEQTPAELAVPLLTTLGPFAKPSATAGGLTTLWIVLALCAVIVGVAVHDRRLVAVLSLVLASGIIVGFGVNPDAGTALALVLWSLLLAVPWERSPVGRSERRFALTTFLGLSVMASALFWPLAWRALRGVERTKLFDFVPPAPRDPRFAALPISPEVTPIDQFYVMSKTLADPELDPDLWSLRVGGAVDRPVDLKLSDLRKMPTDVRPVTLCCVSNPVGGPLMGSGLWSTIRLDHVLATVLPPHAPGYRIAAVDGYSDILRPDEIDGALLAYALNGELLDRRHGSPLRLLLPGRYGFRSVKWISRIDALPQLEASTWEKLGWSAEAAIRPTVRIDHARRQSGTVQVGGVALSPNSGVRSVEVRIDEGAWQPAIVHLPALSPASWVQWWIELTGVSGEHAEARLIDGAGQPQDPTVRPAFPSGSSGYHRLKVVSSL